MTDCSRCGWCCDPVTVPFDPHERAQRRLNGPPLEDWELHQYTFYLEHWTVAGKRGDGVYEVRCDQFDSETRTCSAHKDRPDICSGFPWYDRDPRGRGNAEIAAVLPPQCSYNADVRRMLPLTVVNHGQYENNSWT